MSATTVSACPGDRRRPARAALGRLELTINRSDREVALVAGEVNKLSRSYDAEWAARLVQRFAGIQTELAAAARAVGVEPHLLLAVQARGSAAQRVARVLDDLAFEQLRLSAVMLGLEMPRRSDPTPPAPKERPRHRRGRPPRCAIVSPEFVAAAPFPELATEAADRLPPFIRCIDDPQLLRRAVAFEERHDRRKTVIEALEQRLRVLGAG